MKAPDPDFPGLDKALIVTCLNGGLGNQMFQYAMARSLADRVGTELILDIRELATPESENKVRLDGGVIRDYGLSYYSIRADLARSYQLVLRGFWKSRKLRDGFTRFGLRFGDLVIEKRFTYQVVETKTEGFTYLEGYWQSWKYFEKDRKAILADFTPIPTVQGKNKVLFQKMGRENSVSVHVRLGDYVRSRSTAQAHGNLTPEYYRSALKRIKSWGRNLRFYLFSDEPGEAVRLIGSGFKPIVVDHNGNRPQEDIRLMGNCHYFITANSSFSWWGAWLSQREGKRIIAPKKWFAGLGHDTRDLVPKDWVRL